MASSPMNQHSALRMNRLFRILRIPRLYKTLRIFRLVKLLRLFSGNSYLKKLLKNLNLNLNIIMTLKLLVNFLMLIHVFGCFWYLTVSSLHSSTINHP